MSSHHFVKEGQEPAILIVDQIPFRQAEPFLEWSPLVMVTESVVDHVVAWGIKVDVVFARPEKVGHLTGQLAHHAPVKIIACTAEELLQTAFYFSVNARQKSLAILSCNPNSYFQIKDFSIPHPEISIVTDNMKWSLIQSGRFDKWLPANETVHVYEDRNEILRTEKDGVIEIKRSGFFWIGEEIG